MNPLVIVNPSSGGGRTGSVFESMRAPIERIVGPIDVVFTERKRHAADLAREAALTGRETVVAVGGDGSIHEVVNGLMEARDQIPGNALKTRLGIIGQGTGGDFRRTLGIQHRLDRYCEVIAEGHARRIDVGRFRYAAHDGSPAQGFFVNILSMGMGGLVDQYVADMGRQLGGTLTYLIASVRGLVNSQLGVLQCTMTTRGGETREEVLPTRTLAVCNGRYFGSGMKVAPMAQPDDGVFEIIDLGNAPRFKFFLESSKIYTGAHLKNPGVKHFRCDRFEAKLLNEAAGETFLLDVDGEPLGKLPISIDLVPNAIEVLAPRP
ncbi:MAG TPA: diacylglycerol kinase family protein [Polyangiaceae bacterium]|jgi:YegS/Rv2252/BmrU family lipid kinase|nr:diacylglycerol kinase family protein [Polyangiaceae bacterium]